MCCGLTPAGLVRGLGIDALLTSMSCRRHVVFADPTQEEEAVIKGAVTIVTVNNEDICIIHKPSILTCLRLFEYTLRYISSFLL